MRKRIVVMRTSFEPAVTNPGNPVRYYCPPGPGQPPCRYEGDIRSHCSRGEGWHLRDCSHPKADWDHCRRTGAPGDNEQRCLGCPLYEAPPPPPPPAAPEIPVWPISYPVRRFDHNNLARRTPGLRFNASIIEYGNEYALAFRNGWRGSDIYIAILDRNFEPTGRCVRLDLHHKEEANYGREDPRLFMHQNKIHIAFIGVAGRRRIVHTSQLFARLGPDFQVEDVFYPHYSKRNGWEKNWQFFDHGGQLYAIYTIAPHRILKIESNSATLIYDTPTPAPWLGGEMRGGASPVLVGDEFWCFFHSRIGRAKPTYNIGLYTFEAWPPFRFARIITNPIAEANPATNPDNYADVIFPGGAVLSDGRWTVACGAHDRFSELHQFDHAELESRLVNVNPRVFAQPKAKAAVVTIGIGDKFRDMARANGESVCKNYGFEELVIIDGGILSRWAPPIEKFPSPEKQIHWLKFVIPLICPGLDRWVYADADYRVSRPVYGDTRTAFHSDPRLIAVLDWWPESPNQPYYNAGFYVANRAEHSRLMEWCRDNYFDIPETFGEQCVWNAGIKALGIEVLELPREYNVGKPELTNNAPIGVHGFWSPEQ